MCDRIACSLLFLGLMAAVAGCNTGSGSRPVSFPIWQGHVQGYVTDEGNGDMNTLRDVQIAAGRPGFRAFSNDRTEDSTDFAGVLVGVAPEGSRLWYVYVVGEVAEQQVGSIRLAAVSQVNGQFQWRTGSDDPAASAAYRAHREKAWRDKHGTAAIPQAALNFPAAEDQFTLQVSGGTVTVRETASGAQWKLSLTDAVGDDRR
jgi:hypothetical protein